MPIYLLHILFMYLKVSITPTLDYDALEEKFKACLVPIFELLLLRIVSENTENTIVVFSKNFRITKHKEPNIFFSLFFLFLEQKTILKNCNQIDP